MTADPPSALPSPEPARTPEVIAAAPSGGWAVPAAHGFDWWREGWRLFVTAPWLWVGVTITLVALMYGLPHLPIVGGIAAPILYHVLIAGLLVGAQALDRGQPLSFGHLFACFDRRAWPLILAGLLNLLGWFLVWLVAIVACALIFGYSGLDVFLSADPTQLDFSTLATFGVAAITALLIVAVLGTPLVMAYWFAPTLIALRGDAPIAAFKASFAASLRNVPPLLVFGLLGVAFALLATLPFGLGWIVLVPVLIAAMYASYRDIFEAAR